MRYVTDTCALEGAEFAPGPAPDPAPPGWPAAWTGTCPWGHTRDDSAAYQAHQQAEWERHERECGAPYTAGPAHDPYGSACDLEKAHGGPHEGPDPLGPDSGWRVSWEGGGSCAGDPIPHRHVVRVPAGDGGEADALAYLREALSYGLAADVTVATARAYPGLYVYTPDGCAWVLLDLDGWGAGRSTKAEAALAAAAHPQLAPARYATEGE